MTVKDRAAVEANEIRFFGRFYGRSTLGSPDWTPRLRREMKMLRRLTGCARFGRVLSIGCGEAQFERMLSPHADHITAIDLSAEAIESASRQTSHLGIDNIKFICGPVSKLDLDHQYDLIICLALLHHLPATDVHAFLRDCSDHIAPGGFFYSQDPAVHGVLRTVGRAIMGKRYHTFHSPDERELDPEELREQLTRAGLTSVRIRYHELTLIPASLILRGRMRWLLHICRGVDWIWYHSPFARWASGFAAIARKSEG